MKTVQLLHVQDNRTKIRLLCEAVHYTFFQKKQLLLLAPTLAAATYIDDLLWSTPTDSFLPHRLVAAPTQERIAITSEEQNHNKATILFNLLPKPSILSEQFALIYDFFDTSDAEKKALSENKINTYRQQGFQIND